MRLRSIALAIVVLLFSSSAFAQWQQVYSFPSSQRLTVFYYIPGSCSPSVGFAAFGNYNLYRTSDGGRTWNPNMSAVGDAYEYSCIFFKDATTGWFTLSQPSLSSPLLQAIYKTTDAGLTWNPLPPVGDFAAIYYNKSSKLLFATSWEGGGFDIVSSDEGATWQPFHASEHCGFAFVDDQNGVITSVQDSPFLYTRDAGRTWSEANFDSEAYQPLVPVCDNRIFIANEHSSGIYVSPDVGVTWNRLATIPGNPISGDIKGDTKHLFIQSFDQILESNDQGINWRGIGGPAMGTVYDIRMMTLNGYLFAGDAGGVVFQHRYDSTINKLLLSRDTIDLSNNDCGSVKISSIGGCQECSDSLRFEGITMTGSSNITSLRTPVLHAGIGSGDSISFFRFSNSTSLDTATALIRFVQNGITLDTTIIIHGRSNFRSTLSLSTDTLLFPTFRCVGTRRSILFNAPALSACGDSLRITSVRLGPKGSYSIVHQPSSGIGLSDSIVLDRTFGSGVTDTVPLTITFTQHNQSIDTVVYLIGKSFLPQNAQVGLTSTPAATQIDVRGGDSVQAILFLRSPVPSVAGLNTISCTVSFGNRIFSNVNVAGLNGWSVTKQQLNLNSVDLELTHAPYDIPAGEQFANVTFQVAIGDTDKSDITFSNLLFNRTDPNFELCILASAATRDTLHVVENLGNCGDTLLSNFINKRPVFQIISIAPNPVDKRTSNVTVAISSSIALSGRIVVRNVTGEEVASEAHEFAKGDNKFTLTTASLARGTYFIEIEYGLQTLTRKIVVE